MSVRRAKETEMERVLTAYHGTAFLGGRAVGFKLRSEAERILSADRRAHLVLDFARVEGVSHSFADELLSPLSDMLGKATPSRVAVRNCSSDVAADLRSVADMHGLFMPFVEPPAAKELEPA